MVGGCPKPVSGSGVPEPSSGRVRRVSLYSMVRGRECAGAIPKLKPVGYDVLTDQVGVIGKIG